MCWGAPHGSWARRIHHSRPSSPPRRPDPAAQRLPRLLRRCRLRLPAYAMPIPVHMAWCRAVAATDAEMAEFEAELEDLR
jgi:hypothetical protein